MFTSFSRISVHLGNPALKASIPTQLLGFVSSVQIPKNTGIFWRNPLF